MSDLTENFYQKSNLIDVTLINKGKEMYFTDAKQNYKLYPKYYLKYYLQKNIYR